VEGDNSFAFFIDPAGHLWGTFNGPQYSGGPLIWHGANSRDNSPDGIAQVVPLAKWVTLRFEHDGYASIRLFIDDKLVAANYSIVAGVPAVAAAGVNIGNWTLSDAYTLNGAIDEVKIYRYDPDDMLGHFLCRPLNKDNARCWAAYFEWFADLLRDPNMRGRVIRLMQCVAKIQNELIHQLRSKGEHAIAQNNKLSAHYRKLWCTKPIDSPEMHDWQKRWFSWLIDTIGRDAWEAFMHEMQICFARSELQNMLPNKVDLNKCDPAFVSYLEGFRKAAEIPLEKEGGEYGTY
jgi:hypothetical protein